MIQMFHSSKRSGVLDKTTMIPHRQEMGMRTFQPPCGNSTETHTQPDRVTMPSTKEIYVTNYYVEYPVSHREPFMCDLLG